MICEKRAENGKVGEGEGKRKGRIKETKIHKYTDLKRNLAKERREEQIHIDEVRARKNKERERERQTDRQRKKERKKERAKENTGD